MDSEPSNAVLLAKLEALSEVVKVNQEQNKLDHQTIIQQTTRTNGRVTKLEQGKWMLYGGWAVSSLILVPVVVSFIQTHLK